MNLSVPLSTHGSRTSCCALLNRCISSINRIVGLALFPRRYSAFFIISLSSDTPVPVALSGSKFAFVCLAIIYVRVVLPDPGGPQNIREGISPFSIIFLKGVPSPMISSCPTKSLKDVGRTLNDRVG